MTSSAGHTTPICRPGSSSRPRPGDRCSSSAPAPGGSPASPHAGSSRRPRQRAGTRRRARRTRGRRRGRDRDGLRRRPRARARARVRRDHCPDAVHPPARRLRGRAAVLSAARAHLRPRGLLAAALLADESAIEGEGAGLLPDVRERDQWVFASLPLEVLVDDDGIDVRRLRQIVSPEGELSERTASIHLDRLTPKAFEQEAAAGGFALRERIEVPPTTDHVGTTICVLEVPDGASPARALPGADEHLRRPGRPPLPAPAVRVARDRGRAGASGPGGGSTPPRTT